MTKPWLGKVGALFIQKEDASFRHTLILLFIQAALPCEWTDDGVSPCRMWLELTFVQPLQGFCQCIVTFGLEVAVVGFCDGNVRRKAIAHEV